jgi:hypothetical protein
MTSPIPVRVTVAAVYPELFGAVDYNVNSGVVSPSDAALQHRLGRRVWVYNHNGIYGPRIGWPDGNLRTRALAWWIWKNRFDGFLQYTINRGWGGRRHGHSVWIFPRSDSEPLASIQLELMREGLEDHEYLTLAERAVRRAGLPEEAREELERSVGQAAFLVGASKEDFDMEYGKYLDIRRRIGEVLSHLEPSKEREP